ncbi:MAG: hypothetical protein A3F84_08240 [Candidatus Handelsmanbacteria bacterium RIFCSPLOWO2_12_FULL_64_10]|uniref:Uncharacterized protein n=1 Tax=Handelsmanbacteria sp. (strain RIFCSPLOWO2_12_FULL_64_10) TaxID=1817868 RepID=A0A1F6CJD0_HANXR|nr:MAG: hypothetical protein A3F84_08240 [Candidatus Handelsmanbacteria bacterium RIFCSPLOWO2_12_FULL_64_10]
MKAAWDWHLPRKTEGEQRAVVEFAHACGFDTLIVSGPTEAMVRRGRELGVRVVAVVSPNATAGFVEQRPECLQVALPVEENIAAAVSEWAPPRYQHLSHRWFSIVQSNRLLCYEHPESQEELKRRVRGALTVADGVAFDGFGFQNHYACFCDRCRGVRERMMEEGMEEEEAIRRMSEESLVDVSHHLYLCAKDAKPDAVVTNHVWPPFNPNPYYGCRLRLDYCTQTISWFYRPVWSIERVAFEAAEMKRLEDLRANVFAPFIGVYADPDLVRPEDRLAQELEIAGRYGHVALCTLGAPRKYPEIFRVVKAAMARIK